MEQIRRILNEEIENTSGKKRNLEIENKLIEEIKQIKEKNEYLTELNIDLIEKYLDQKTIKELQVYKMLLESHLFTLTKEQQEKVFTILKDVEEKVNEQIQVASKENIEVEKKLKVLTSTNEKLKENNFDYIKEKDLFIINPLLEKLSKKEQLSVLKQMIILNGKKAHKSVLLSDTLENIEDFEETNISYEDVSKLCEKYNVELPNNNHLQNNLLKYGNLENIDQILNLLDKEHLLNEIDYKEKRNKQFIDVLSYSNIDIVNKMVTFSKERKINFDFLLNAPSNFIPSNRQRRRPSVYKKRKGGETKERHSNNTVVRGTADFFDKNIILLESIGFDAKDVIEHNYSTLSNIHLEEMLQTLMLYGFEIDENIALSGMVNGRRIDYIIDKYIELDLHSYIKEHASGLNNYTYKHFENIYYTRQANLPVLNENGTLSRKTLEMIGQPEESKRIIDLEKRYKEEQMPIDRLYEIEANPDYNDWTKVWASPEIQQLESENKVDDFTYRIAGMTISRPKVLRIYNGILKDENIDTEKGLLFAVTSSSLLNEEEFNGIKKKLKERVR